MTESKDIFYFHLLRVVAAFAVVMIHVLGPWRELYGVVPQHQWFSATAINAVSRWAVPVFIMLSGALLLFPSTPLNAQRYLQRRVAKVVVPFLAWSLIYCLISGGQSGDWQHTWDAILALPKSPSWYHLWFFYDFIPLYFVIPLLGALLAKMSTEQIKLLLVAWLLLTLTQWLRIDTPLRINLLLYSGYLLLGWFLHQQRQYWRWWLGLGGVMLLVNVVGSGWAAELKGGYSAKYMSYKTLNTALIAAMVFVLAQRYGYRVSRALHRPILSLSRYSLGIYLLHPLLLIPIRPIDNGVYHWFGHPLLAIPLLSVMVLLLSWLLVAAVSKIPIIKQLVP
ncbi:acyltransferase family protein [uncultured Ferrimonas sp.]|uniref:acyltransferase n=1 Tax=uncultured Ferrimonas sp. TaxID=432640 RepID=UPI00262B764D|nr:acyltransferase family protein [uncultured Ferrimonas sp.]